MHKYIYIYIYIYIYLYIYILKAKNIKQFVGTLTVKKY